MTLTLAVFIAAALAIAFALPTLFLSSIAAALDRRAESRRH